MALNGRRDSRKSLEPGGRRNRRVRTLESNFVGSGNRWHRGEGQGVLLLLSGANADRLPVLLRGNVGVTGRPNPAVREVERVGVVAGRERRTASTVAVVVLGSLCGRLGSLDRVRSVRCSTGNVCRPRLDEALTAGSVNVCIPFAERLDGIDDRVDAGQRPAAEEGGDVHVGHALWVPTIGTGLCRWAAYSRCLQRSPWPSQGASSRARGCVR